MRPTHVLTPQLWLANARRVEEEMAQTESTIVQEGSEEHRKLLAQGWIAVGKVTGGLLMERSI